MRYILVSDIHGEYQKLIDELTSRHFNCAKDTLVVLGDIFDRGVQNEELLVYLLSLPKKIIVLGNHDLELLSFIKAAEKDNYYPLHTSDVDNGMVQTFYNLAGNKGVCSYTSQDFVDCGPDYAQKRREVNDYITLALLRHSKDLHQLYEGAVFGLQFNDKDGTFATHGWLPPEFARNSERSWYEATWANTPFYIRTLLNSKPVSRGFRRLVFGHWWASDLNSRFNRSDCKEYNRKFVLRTPTLTLIGLDGKSNAISGVVNSLVVYATSYTAVKVDEEPGSAAYFNRTQISFDL